MGLSLGWLLLLGGALGSVRVLRAKTFSWANEVDTVVTEEDRQREAPMTPFKRWVLVAICFLLAIVGAVLIQRQHNWNPLQSGRSSDRRMPSRPGEALLRLRPSLLAPYYA
jgi:hypothetical protein